VRCTSLVLNGTDAAIAPVPRLVEVYSESTVTRHTKIRFGDANINVILCLLAKSLNFTCQLKVIALSPYTVRESLRGSPTPFPRKYRLAIVENWYDQQHGQSLELSAKAQLGRQASKVLVVIRVTMAIFPYLTILGSYGQLTYPGIEFIGLTIIAVQCLLMIASLGRVSLITPNKVVGFDLIASGLVLLICTIGAGSVGRHHALDGLLPYLLAVSGLVGASYRRSKTTVVLLAVLVIAWQFVPLGHDLVARLSDVFGLIFWGGLGAFVTTALDRMATQVDAQHDQAVAMERREVESWVHDDLINLVGRVARSEPLSLADRARAARLEISARLRIADVRVIAPGVEGLLEAATIAAEESGVKLVVETAVTSVPQAPHVLQTMALAIPCLIDNAKRHGNADRVRLALFADSERIVLTLSDRGDGYDLATAIWGAHTRSAVFDAMESVEGSAIPQTPPDGIGSIWRLQWPK